MRSAYGFPSGLRTGLPKIVGLNTTSPPIFHHPVARDLAWMILNPSLITPGKYHCPADFHRHGGFGYDFVVPSSPWQVHAWHALAPILMQGSEITRALDALQLEKSNRRLGLYFERLMRFWFTHSPQFEIIAKGLAVRQTHKISQRSAHPHKTKTQHHKTTTLGECDYLIFDKTTQALQHWEVAVKFYLGLSLPTAPESVTWLGPNLKDRLDLKLYHTLNHQLPLSISQAAKKALNAHVNQMPNLTLSTAAQNALSNSALPRTPNQPDSITRVLWIKGALYTDIMAPRKTASTKLISAEHTFSDICPAFALNPFAQKGNWCTPEQINIYQAPQEQFNIELPRQCWLGHRNAANVLAQCMRNDVILCQRTKARIMPSDTPPSAQHRASFNAHGTMLRRYFQVSRSWLSAGRTQLISNPDK